MIISTPIFNLLAAVVHLPYFKESWKKLTFLSCPCNFPHTPTVPPTNKRDKEVSKPKKSAELQGQFKSKKEQIITS